MEGQTLINTIGSPLSSKASPQLSPASSHSSSNISTPPASSTALSDELNSLPSRLSPIESTLNTQVSPTFTTSSHHRTNHHNHNSHQTQQQLSPTSLHQQQNLLSNSMRAAFGNLYSPVSLSNKDAFPVSSSMCVPLTAAFYGSAFNQASNCGGNSFLAGRGHLSPHAYATQMTLFNNSLTQALSGRPLMGVSDDHRSDRFGNTFTPAAYRNLSSSYHNQLKSTFPLCSNSAVAAAAAAAAAAAVNTVGGNVNGSNNVNSINNGNNSNGNFNVNSYNRNQISPTSSTSYKRRHDDDLSLFGDRLNLYSNGALGRSWLGPRSPGQPLVCPLCGISLEANDIASHFYEEVHKMETLRKAFDWETKDNLLAGNCDLKSGDNIDDVYKRTRLLHEKMQPCTRWQTYQRVKHNRQARLSGLLRCKRYADEKTDKHEEINTVTPKPKGIWSIAEDIDDHKTSEVRSSIDDDYLKRDLPVVNSDNGYSEDSDNNGNSTEINSS